MATTIQISDNVKRTLDGMKIFERETYNEIIENMIEDNLQLNEKTKSEITEAKRRIESGKFVTFKDVKNKFNL